MEDILKEILAEMKAIRTYLTHHQERENPNHTIGWLGGP